MRTQPSQMLSRRFTCAFVISSILFAAFSGNGLAGKPQPPAPPPPPPSFRYDIEFLGVLPGGTWSAAFGMNNHGDVVGHGNSASPANQAFLWSAETRSMISLNSLIDPNQRCEFWVAMDINDAGQVTGYAYFDEDGDGVRDPFGRAARFNPDDDGDGFGSVQTLGVPIFSGSNQRGSAINAQGDVVGWFSQNGLFHAFLYTNEDGFIDLGTGPANSVTQAQGISDRDPLTGAVTVVGTFHTSGYIPGWRTSWVPGVSKSATLTPIPSKYSDSRTPPMSAAYGVNNQGEIVGETAVARESYRAGRYTVANGWVNLGTLAPSTAKSWRESWANAINNSTVDHPSITVGASMTGNINDVPNIRAFIYSDPFKMWDLASLVDTPTDYAAGLGEPAAVNDQKWICGPLERYDGPAYVLIPKPAP